MTLLTRLVEKKQINSFPSWEKKTATPVKTSGPLILIMLILNGFPSIGVHEK